MEKYNKMASSTDDMVQLPRAEYEEMQKKLDSLQQEVEYLLQMLRLSKKRQFGQSSEKSSEETVEQLSFVFNEAEAADAECYAQESGDSKVKAYTRKRRSGSLTDVIPEGLPTQVVEHDLSAQEQLCPVCGEQMSLIGKEERHTLVITPPQFIHRIDVYYNYACKSCEAQSDEALIVKTPKEPTFLPGSFASPEAVAHVTTQKFVMYSPLYRQEQELNRQGIKLSRQTMSNWLLNASEAWLHPIYHVLHKALVAHAVLHGDETTLQVLKEPGKSATSKSYMWLYRTSGDAEHPIVLYEYQPDRKPIHAKNFLEGFTGWFHADGYQGYHTLPDNIRVVGCWAHARRKFDEALNAVPKAARSENPAAVGEAYCSKLFQLEQDFADLSSDERYNKRREQSQPVLDAFLAWVQNLKKKTTPKSALGKALNYVQEQWPYLIRFLEDGRLELSNNRAERSIKPFVMGRKNFLFANTPAGAQSSAVVYSLIETAKENHLDPYRYLLWIFQEAPKVAASNPDWAKQFMPQHAPDVCKSL